MTINIFLSHASEDAAYAILLASEIEREFIPNVKVFASSRPSAIPSGTGWLNNVLTNLDKADVLVILITTASQNSIWVSFELGYFWKKTGGKQIHTLYHPKAKIPSPLNTLQAKQVTDKQQLEDFFQVLSKEIGYPLTNSANIDRLVDSANSLSKAPPQRSLANFERLLETSEWDKIHDNDQEIWICADDVLFQIIIDSDELRDLELHWTQKFFKPAAYKYDVRLTIAGLTVKKLFFISVLGGNCFVPLPDDKTEYEMKTMEFGTLDLEWRRDTLIFKIAKIISQFDRMYPTFEDFAAHAGIKII
jgi:hypothetical protein